MAMIKLLYIYDGALYNCNGSHATAVDVTNSKGVRIIKPINNCNNLSLRYKQVLLNILKYNILIAPINNLQLIDRE